MELLELLTDCRPTLAAVNTGPRKDLADPLAGYAENPPNLRERLARQKQGLDGGLSFKIAAISHGAI